MRKTSFQLDRENSVFRSKLLKENPYRATGGTGKFKGLRGGGTYRYDQLTDTLFGGRYNSKWELP